MLVLKKKYYLFVENTTKFNFNLIKIRKKFNIIYRNQINKEKRTRALKVIDQLAEYSELSFHREASERHNYYLLAAEMKPGLRDRFIRRMAEHHRIQCVVQYYPLNRYPFYRDLGFGDAHVPNTDKFFDNMVSFPFSHLLRDEEIDAVVAATKETIRQPQNFS